MKDIIVLCLLTYLNLRKNGKVENGKWKRKKKYLYLLIVHISTNNVRYGLNFWVHISNICIEGTLSQI